MKILIELSSDSELIGYETFALAFLLASFDHYVQLCLVGDSVALLNDKSTRVFGMIQSLALYDLPVAWVGFKTDDLDPVLHAVLNPKPQTYADFDSILHF